MVPPIEPKMCQEHKIMDNSRKMAIRHAPLNLKSLIAHLPVYCGGSWRLTFLKSWSEDKEKLNRTEQVAFAYDAWTSRAT